MKAKYTYSIGSTINLKVIIIGDKNQGKTSIIKRYIEKKFDDKSIATIVPVYSSKNIIINGINYKINLWDIPGQDLNPIVTRSFANETKGIIYCYEVNNSIARDNLKKWKESLESNINIADIPKIILENKCDLLGDESHFNDDSNLLKKTSLQLGCLNYFRTSALNGYNIDNAINFLLNEMIKKEKEEGILEYNIKNTNTKLTKKAHNKNKNARCC